MKKSRFRLKQSAIIAASIHLIFAEVPAWAGPTGPQVVNGTAAFAQPNASTLNVTNSPGAIINWKGFSIGAGELTRFIQQSSSSSVLNRVVGADISQIYGQLLSNGRVFLINPSGIVIGPGAVVDTAGFVASTLNMLDADFLAGKLKFQGDAVSGSIVNQGWIRTGYGGKVILVAPQIENSGLIHTPGGELILAAGQKLTITSLDLEGVQFEIQAPTDSVVNLGKLLADGGAVGVFAGTLRHSGEIRANALVYDEAGRVILKAQNDIQVAAGSTTSADGKAGGAVTVQSSGGLTRVAGNVSATGSAGPGGSVQLLGNRVSVVENAVVDASGSTRGGQILVGGDYQGGNSEIQNSSNTFVGSGATLRADATQSGDGGRVVVWSDDKTQFYGNLSAQGGPDSGNGGFAEVSGKQGLVFAGGANLGAPKGSLGTLLLDPPDVFVFSGGGLNPFIIDEATDFPSNAATVSPTTLAAITGNVTLFASRYMRISSPIALTGAGQGLTATVGTYSAPLSPDPLALSTGTIFNVLDVGANITTAGGAVSLNAPTIQSVAAATISTAGGAINLTSGGAIQAQFFSSPLLSLDAGSGSAIATASGGGLRLGTVTSGSFTGTATSTINTGTITTTGAVTLSSSGSSINTSNIASGGGAVTLTSGGSSISTSDITTGGGNVTANAAFSVGTGVISTSGGTVSLTGTNSSVSASGIPAGSGPVSLSGTTVSTGTIDTTSSVALTATSGSIFATVNNASSLTATATNSSSSSSVSIGSSTDLNANSVSATTTACFSFFGCQSGSVTLSATGNVNVGTVTATAPVSGNNSISESVSISSSTGSIRAMSASSQVTAADVTLSTGVGTGGGIGTAATALNVDVERNFTFRPNGEFNVLLNGTGPSGLTAQVGVAPATLSYSGTLSRSGGGLTLNASATDTIVTVSNLAVTSGFNQRVFNSTPFITLRVPNGALVASSVTVPEGDTNPTTISPPFTTATLPVSISSSGNLTVNSYTRQSTASSLAKTTSFQSDTGTITLGTINASKDSVNVNGSGNVSVSNLNTAGAVSVTSSGADVIIDRIDTTSGTGTVSVNANFGAVKAQTDSVATEITSGGSINITGKTIGDSTFTNPLDVAASAVTLTSQGSGGQIGFTGKPVVSNTQTLTVNAASATAFNVNTGATFNVSTGATALKNLTVTANPTAVGLGGLAQVSTEVGTGNAKTYVFDNTDGASFTFNPGAIPSTQFASGTLSFTSTNGNVTLGNINMGTGGLSVAAPNGSITGGANLDGSSLTLSAGTGVSGSAVNITTGNIGANVRPSGLQITSGNNGFFTQRSGSVTTGTIEAGTIGITSFNGNITVGNIGSATPAGAVTLSANNKSFSDAGAVMAGNIRSGSINLSTGSFGANPVMVGNLDATSSITINSDTTIQTALLDSPAITITRTPTCCPAPAVSTGAIGNARPVQQLNIFGSTVAIGGAVTGDPTQADNVNIDAVSGALTLTGGTITAGNGSTVSLSSNGLTPFQFTTINTGATGTVDITSSSGIQQTADTAGSGITAKTVTLSATGSSAPISNTADTAFSRLDLNGTTNLTVDAGGTARFDAHNSQFTDLTITKRQIPDTAQFELANMGGGQTLSIGDSGNGISLSLASPAALNFSVNYTADGGITLTGGGIATSDGNVSLSSSGLGAFINANTGGITTSGGTVDISASGAVSTGAINTTGPINTGGSIFVSASGNIDVSGNLATGPGPIQLFAGSAITRSGGSTIASDASVTVTASSGDIGANGTPLLITTPTATLSARGSTIGVGNVFATLTNTSALNLTADNDFGVSSNTALGTLSLTTEGSGTGTTLSLTAPGQTYSFARPATDLFSTAMTNTFQVIAASGPTTATFRASDGDLFVGGSGTSITVPTLNLQTGQTFGAGDIKLQGTTGGPLSLINPTQNFSAGRDLLITGNASLNASTSQTLAAGGNITAQAQGGSIALSASNQTIQSTSGTVSFLGGSAADEKVTVSASNAQTIQTFQFSGGQDIKLQGGTGDRASATVSYTGTGTQTIQANRDVLIFGGGGTSTDSIAEITTATGSQLIRAENNINLTGGAGTNAIARIRNNGTGNQQVGESRRFCCTFTEQYQTNNITLQGGGGAGSVAEIAATGPQQIYSQFGTLSVLGGSGTNAFARIESSGTSEQQIGAPTYLSSFSFSFQMGGLSVQGGSGTGSYGRINATGFQRVTASSSIGLVGNAADASASLLGAGQDIRFGNTTLTAGTGNNANALIQSTSTQNIDPGNLILQGGGGAGATATAQILAADTQSIGFANTVSLSGGAGPNSVARIATTGNNQSLSFSSLSLTGGTGTGSFAKVEMTGTSSPLQQLSGGSVSLTAGSVDNTGAIIEGNHQEINLSSFTATGGTGTSGNTSDAVIRNLARHQEVFVSGNITLNSGSDFSTTGILNLGPEYQTVEANGAISLNSVATATTNAPVLIENSTVSLQTISAGSIDVQTIAGSAGNASLASTGNQRIHTTSGTSSSSGNSMRVAALGTGTASVTAGASQLVELDYPEQMQGGAGGKLMVGDVNAAGISRVKALDQNVFARSITIQGGLANSTSELKASGTQIITTLQGGISVLGGSGDNSLAQIDPLTQIILSNGTVDVVGGSGVNAIAQIVSSGVQVIVGTNGNITLSGGTGANADALISTPGSLQTISTVGTITLAAGAGVGADASIINANGTITAPFTSSVGATLGAPLSSIFVSSGGSGSSSGADTAGDFGISQVLADQANQTAVLGEIPPSAEEGTELPQRAPICR